MAGWAQLSDLVCLGEKEEGYYLPGKLSEAHFVSLISTPFPSRLSGSDVVISLGFLAIRKAA